MSDGQWCELQRRQVTRGGCHACNKEYRLLGVHPFLRCFGGHTFSPLQAVCRGQEVFCPRCNQGVVPEQPTGGHFCCDRVECSDNCDWYLNPNHCNLARDPEDARKFFDTEADLVYPQEGRVQTVMLDGYRVAMHQISNQEVLRIKDEDLKSIGKQLTEQWTNIKFLHKGNADEICKDIQAAYNRLLKDKYSRVKVEVTFEIKPGKMLPQISITGGNSITAWLLHELVPYVSI